MATASYTYNVTVAGYSASKAVLRTGDHNNAYEVALPVAHALSSWVKTDADTAAGNLTAGHGLTTGVFDVYWDGGQRYGVTCTITSNAVALDGGAGTDFPASADTTVRMAPRVTINTQIDGDAIEIAFLRLVYADADSTQRGRLLFEDAAGDDIFDCDTADGLDANETLIYDVDGGATNPFAGDLITVCTASQSGTAAGCTAIIAILEDSTP